MRVLVDLPDGEFEWLNDLSRFAQGLSDPTDSAGCDCIPRAESSWAETSFGVWKQRNEDGIIYYEKLRDEWER